MNIRTGNFIGLLPSLFVPLLISPKKRANKFYESEKTVIPTVRERSLQNRLAPSIICALLIVVVFHLDLSRCWSFPSPLISLNRFIAFAFLTKICPRCPFVWLFIDFIKLWSFVRVTYTCLSTSF